MQLSCLPVSFFLDIIEGRMPVSDWARIGADAGLDAIDLSILFIPDQSLESARAIRHEIEAVGIAVAMVTTYPDFTHPSESQRLDEIRFEKRAVDIATELDADLVRVTAGQAHPETSVSDGIKWAVEGLRAMQEYAQEKDIMLVYENHGKPGAWDYTDFSEPPDIFLEIAGLVIPSGMGINYDTGNAAAFSADPVGLLDEVIDHVVSVHASDTATRGELNHVLLGTGITPFDLIFERLVEVGWNEWICIEEASYQGEEGVNAAVQFVRQTWLDAYTRITLDNRR